MADTDSIKMPRGWKAVPVPVRIAELPRDLKKGFPIPYVAEWENDPTGTLSEQGGWAIATCNCKIGEGEADLGHQCPVRQRECVENRICQVCAEKISPSEDVAFIGGPALFVFDEPGLHVECAAYALRVCPGITRRAGVMITLCHRYEVLRKWEFMFDTMNLPMDKMPARVAQGEKAVVAYYSASPIDGRRHLAETWLAERAKE